MDTSEFESAIQKCDAEVAALKELWRRKMPEVLLPSDEQFRLWLKLHDCGVVRHGINRAARKFQRAGFDAHGNHAVRYASSAMNG
jgi:hypothetical protein